MTAAELPAKQARRVFGPQLLPFGPLHPPTTGINPLEIPHPTKRTSSGYVMLPRLSSDFTASETKSWSRLKFGSLSFYDEHRAHDHTFQHHVTSRRIRFRTRYAHRHFILVQGALVDPMGVVTGARCNYTTSTPWRTQHPELSSSGEPPRPPISLLLLLTRACLSAF